MAIDRTATIRNAEKLIRQGKLDAAIAEYVRLVEDQPQDWNTANVLGDLYARAGQVDKAVEHFIQIADSLNDEGAVAKAGAVYKKILKVKPDHERALLQLSEILGNQGLYADARAHLNTVVELRTGRGDTRGALQAKVQLGSLDPADYDGRLAAVGARREMGDVGGALSDLKEIAGELAEKGRQDDAIEVLKEAQTLNPKDEEVREKLLDVYMAAGDLPKARECATTVEQFKMVAASFEARGNTDEALETMVQASSHDPSDTELKADLARKFIARGDLATAAEYLTVETAGDDPELLLTVADIQLRGDKVDDGMAIVRRLLEQDASRRDQIALLGWTVAEKHPDAGFQVVEVVADTAVAQTDWPSAAAALQEFVTRVPNHVAALMRLVEICVDGGLEATMYSAQAQLADAYIASGSATEARFIAEDLVAREPWDKANIERFRQALVLLGEPDPDGLIAKRLSGESPFTSTDLLRDAPIEPGPEPEPEPDPEAEALKVEELLAEAAAAEESVRKPTSKWKPAPRKEEGRHFELSANAIDLDSILGEFEEEPMESPAEHAAGETADVEVDLSIDLNEIRSAQAPTVPSSTSSAKPADLGGAFKNLRAKAKGGTPADIAEEEYRRGLALRAAGDVDGCIEALTAASQAPRLRFVTASLLGGLFRERGMMPQAIEWLERAAQAPAPTPEEGHQLLYELVDGLEKVGETARALAISLELQAEAGPYKDLEKRIDRLTKVQAG